MNKAFKPNSHYITKARRIAKKAKIRQHLVDTINNIIWSK